jgi:hypothetical protein
MSLQVTGILKASQNPQFVCGHIDYLPALDNMAKGKSEDEPLTVTFNPLLLDEQQTLSNIRSPSHNRYVIHQYSNKHKYKCMYVCIHVYAYRDIFSSQMLHAIVFHGFTRP